MEQRWLGPLLNLCGLLVFAVLALAFFCPWRRSPPGILAVLPRPVPATSRNVRLRIAL